ncbi:ThuA domain-containing protein [Brevundimonas sp. UBA7534]|uniref:ThuA domain-containing protein n=1 Tax=Brevundimonas sp. UBA7534 TaxID=1946138 RepID=UPI0025BB24E8|nr:ThuA domain-containing protein [Brevundimonas sp. UBA7534]
MARTVRFLMMLTAMLCISLGGLPATAQAPGTSAPPGMRDPYAGKKKLLVVADVQTGFQHDSISRAMAEIERMGRESGDFVAFLRTDSQLLTSEPIEGVGARYSGRYVNARNLEYFDAVFFLGSGEGTLSDAQKADLLAFVREGKGFIGGHASTIAFYDWPEYLEMIGGLMEGEFPVAPRRLVVEDPDFPGVDGFPSEVADQYQYLTAPYDPSRIHTILRLDAQALAPELLARHPDGDFPVVWAREYGQGRVFVSTFGHLDEAWDNPAIRRLYLEGIRWALGLTQADVTPDTQQSSMERTAQ